MVFLLDNTSSKTIMTYKKLTLFLLILLSAWHLILLIYVGDDGFVQWIYQSTFFRASMITISMGLWLALIYIVRNKLMDK